MQAYLLLTAALSFNAIANILIKYSMSRQIRPLFSVQGTSLAAVAPFLTWPFLLGIVCFATNLACYSLALRSLKLSFAYPLMVSLGYLLIVVVSWFLFGERLSPVQYLGVGLILVGLWLVVR
jgi:multidrug transporter EmrE-like cation transporter